VAHRTLMRLYVRQGRPAQALKQYQVCTEVLRRELGVDPEAETKRLYQNIRQVRGAETSEASIPGRPAVHPSRSDSPHQFQKLLPGLRPTVHSPEDEAGSPVQSLI